MRDDPDRLVRLTTTGSATEADIIQAVLRANGIDAVISESHSSHMLPHYVFGRGVPILVRQSDLQAAKAILEQKGDAWDSE